MARNCLRFLGVYALWRVWLVFLTLLAPLVLPFQLRFSAYLFEPLRPVADWVWPWANMDGVVFMLIARSGYETAQLPFFPLFPTFIRLLQGIIGCPFIVAGLIVSTVCFLTALFVLFRLLRLEKRTNLFFLLCLLYISFPTGHYLTAVYNDALFVLFSISTLYFGRQHRYLEASVVGFFATLTRLNGLALAVFLGFEYLLQVNPELALNPSVKELYSTFLKALRPREWWRSGIAWALLIPSALLGYLAWIQWQFGNWYLFFAGVQVWHRDHLTFPLQTFWRYVKMMLTVPMNTPVFWVAASELFFALFYVAWLVWAWKKVRFSYLAFWAASWLIPAMTGTFQGMPRYGLHILPLFLSIALWLEDKPVWVRWTWIAVSLIFQAIFVLYYATGYFVT
jgi:hypothetical protein